MINPFFNVPDWGELFSDPAVAFCCDICGGEVYAGERYYRIDKYGLKLCTDCVNISHAEAACEMEGEE